MQNTKIQNRSRPAHPRTIGYLSYTLFSGLLLGLLAGCGEPQPTRVLVSGTVLIDGQPLKLGTIRFVPDSGRPSSSAILSDGTFDLASTTLEKQPIQRGVVPGKYQIEISALEPIDEESMRWHAPKKYASFRTSGLEQSIEKTTENLVIELTWDGVEGPIVEGPGETEFSETPTSQQEKTPEDTTPPAIAEDESSGESAEAISEE